MLSLVADGPFGESSLELFGRAHELELFDQALRALPERGGALVFRGEPGIGKSVLLDAARSSARSRGVRVLSTVGVEAESELPYSGLHRLLRPLLGSVDSLPAPQQSSLLAAFGIADDEASELYLVALGALGLLEAEAAKQPLLVTVDDIHWLDTASRDAVAFIGRRLDADPVFLLGATRDDPRAAPQTLGLPEHRIEALDSDAASELLSARAPMLAPAVRRRLLEDAAGNPLALMELPTTVDGWTVVDDAAVPLSTRLEQAFAFRVREMTAETRAILLVFASDVASSLSEVLEATELVLGHAVALSALQPAIEASLISVDGSRVRFRHPLVRAAIYQGASLEQRQAAHAALAEVVRNQPDRRAHHRAAAAAGPDEDVASDVEHMGLRARRRGAVLEASAALTRAADLSVDPAARVRRLLAAAEPAFEAGRADLVRGLVERARRESLSEHDSARVEWLSEIFHDGAGPGQGDAAHIRHLVALAKSTAELHGEENDDDDLTPSLLIAAALRCWWGNSEPAVRKLIVDAVRGLPGPQADPRRIVAIAVADPLDQGRSVVELIDQAVGEGPLDGRSAHLLGEAAHAVGAYDHSLRLFASASESLRDHGQLALLAQTLVMQSTGSFAVGNFAVCRAAASEAAGLAAETGQPIWLAGATGPLAGLAAIHGDVDKARELAAEALATLDATGSSGLLGWLVVIRGVIELAAGRFEEAYDEIARVFDKSDPAHHIRDQFFGVSYLVDAAVGSGQLDSARQVVASLAAGVRPDAPEGIRPGILYAVPLLAADDVAESEFRAALAAPWSARPFERARLQLAYGMWLRRQRRVVESRDPLRLARSGFDALAMPAWGERARQELRAAGETSSGRQRHAWDELSPQEMQIAQLAAAGLSNREIGQRLYLSHRTVASHLYRTFPKLGITSRSQLNSALPAEPPVSTGESP
jgi:DNA-binding CsgD family transcriptional regulator